MDVEKISKKKYFYPVSKSFKKYLKRYTRESNLPVSYDTLRHFQNSIPLHDKEGKDTYWETVFLPSHPYRRDPPGVETRVIRC
jgi:hypothetical protein